MERYVNQFIEDLKALARERRNRPRPFEGHTYLDEAGRERAEMELYFADIDRDIRGDARDSMFKTLGLLPEQFPPPDRLSDAQVERMVSGILELWEAYRHLVDIPAGAEPCTVYPLLLASMAEEFSDPVGNSFVHVALCGYDPGGCPWPDGLCDCSTDDTDLEEWGEA